MYTIAGVKMGPNLPKITICSVLLLALSACVVCTEPPTDGPPHLTPYSVRQLQQQQHRTRASSRPVSTPEQPSGTVTSLNHLLCPYQINCFIVCTYAGVHSGNSSRHDDPAGTPDRPAHTHPSLSSVVNRQAKFLRRLLTSAFANTAQSSAPAMRLGILPQYRNQPGTGTTPLTSHAEATMGLPPIQAVPVAQQGMYLGICKRFDSILLKLTFYNNCLLHWCCRCYIKFAYSWVHQCDTGANINTGT